MINPMSLLHLAIVRSVEHDLPFQHPLRIVAIAANGLVIFPYDCLLMLLAAIGSLVIAFSFLVSILLCQAGLFVKPLRVTLTAWCQGFERKGNLLYNT